MLDLIEEPSPGDIFRHFKGGWYKVVTLAKGCDSSLTVDGKKFVVYHLVTKKDQLFVRSLEDFLSTVECRGEVVPRFKLVI